MMESASSPARKIGWAIFIGLLLSIPLFSVWLMVYDRQSQSRAATDAITAGWGGRQILSAPIIAVPYRQAITAAPVAGTATPPQRQEIAVAPEGLDMTTQIVPEIRRKSIYEAVVYVARVKGTAVYGLPGDIGRGGIDIERGEFDRAELRFGISDPRGVGANPRVSVNGQILRLQPGGGSGPGTGFFAWLDASALKGGQLKIDFSYDLRGSDGLALLPSAGTTQWALDSSWPSPSFGGGFLPARRSVSDSGFDATYTIGNLATGRTIAELRDVGAGDRMSREVTSPSSGGEISAGADVQLVRPVDFYSRVDRSAKYGFLFIGFTFLALFLFDVVGGARVAAIEYLLTGAGLVLFFVLLLAFAEIIGFTAAYVLAAAAITGLVTAYSAAVLISWRRAQFIGGLLVALYALLYVLLSLEAYSLLIGSLLLFVALAGMMYVTRNVDWSGEGARSRA